MRNATLPILLGGISVVVLVLVLLFSGRKDTNAPEIQFTDECMTVFSDNDDVDMLMQGVKAVDEKDGDVTDTLRIQNITVIKDECRIVVHYSARDKDNNIVKAEKTYDYTGTKEYINVSVLDEDIFDDSNSEETSSQENDTTEPTSSDNSSESTGGENSSDESTSPDDSSDQGETSSDGETTTPDDGDGEDETTEPNDEESETIDRAEVDETGIPQIRMKYHELTIPVGGDFYFMDPLAEWYDDKDDVSRRVIIIGDYDVDVAGVYSLTYYVSDSDGNTSNREPFILTVE